MTPGARISAAIAVLDDWRGGTPVEQALTRWARGARYAGSKDRAAVRDHVYDALRRAESCAQMGGGRDGRAMMLGLLRLQGRDPAELFTGDGHAPAPLSAAQAEAPSQAPSPECDIPDWLRAPVSDQVDDPEALFASFAHRAPLWLRVNLRRATPEAVVASLAADGVTARTTPLCTTALEVTEGERALRRAAAYLDGVVEPQDLSVQRALDRVDWPGQGRILDYCAGGGGKALALADRSDAAIFAHDANPGRMADLGPRAARAGVSIRQVATAGLEGHAPFDAVLCDVPCSGSGTWRRDPEAKWRLTPARLDKLCATQDAILVAAARLVGAQGRLVYMTCSLLRVENEDRIDAFLARHPGWRLEHQGRDTPLTASDGFFCASLSRDG
ncbi:RsmB/NOP family class I SAM-dependent RNA methyltransferase [[Roseibacterium] beibuensis]|uniref:RsmB/NOP family class I SAM-dependent RNA methyltransferase n=1 Tax=[Roseibacterium] beibuensis TaxID=1193142 RepID=A0ABP9L363_9RHOB|nr:RsmB/NOP family class I SAM-dependent RNA methyltransferase [Roseibacterium beibuensis]